MPLPIVPVVWGVSILTSALGVGFALDRGSDLTRSASRLALITGASLVGVYALKAATD
jgi:hypothetical protein